MERTLGTAGHFKRPGLFSTPLITHPWFTSRHRRVLTREGGKVTKLVFALHPYLVKVPETQEHSDWGNRTMSTDFPSSRHCSDLWFLKVGAKFLLCLEELGSHECLENWLLSWLEGLPGASTFCTDFSLPRLPGQGPERTLGGMRGSAAQSVPAGKWGHSETGL